MWKEDYSTMRSEGKEGDRRDIIWTLKKRFYLNNLFLVSILNFFS